VTVAVFFYHRGGNGPTGGTVVV